MRIGIDLGGTKTEIICLGRQNQVLLQRRVPSPQGSYRETIATITSLIGYAEDELQQSGTVGIGIPGSVNQQNQQVKNSNSTWINGKPLIKDLQQALAREIRVDNDANCFTLSEANDGAAAGARSVFGIILGTGCGGGLLVNHQLVVGPTGLGGEWGHNPLPFPLVYSETADKDTTMEQQTFFERAGKTAQSAIYAYKKPLQYFTAHRDYSEYPGPLCYCGKRGCLETWLSGPGLANDYYRVNGIRENSAAIVAAAEAGEVPALEAMERYHERLAKSLAQIINVIDPEIIVLGGGMSNIPTLYTRIPERWDKYIFSDHITTKLVKARHGDASGVRGAALLWDNVN